MSKQNAQQIYENIYRQRMSKVSFPDEIITKKFLDLLKIALRYNSFHGIKCTKECYENFCNKYRSFGIAEIEVATGLVFSLTPNELGVSVDSYPSELEDAFIIRQKMLDITEKVVEATRKEFDAKMRIIRPS